MSNPFFQGLGLNEMGEALKAGGGLVGQNQANRTCHRTRAWKQG